MDPSSREYIYSIYIRYIFYIFSIYIFYIYVFSAGGRISIYSMKWSLFLPSLVDIGLLKPPAENVERNQSSFLTPQHVNGTFSLNATVSRGQWYCQVPRSSCELGNLTTNETTFNSVLHNVCFLTVGGSVQLASYCLYKSSVCPPSIYTSVLFPRLWFWTDLLAGNRERVNVLWEETRFCHRDRRLWIWPGHLHHGSCHRGVSGSSMKVKHWIDINL